MFDTLTDRFDGIFSRIRGRGKLTEADVDETMREIRLALLEADVNLDVVKSIVSRIRERSIGEELSKALVLVDSTSGAVGVSFCLSLEIAEGAIHQPRVLKVGCVVGGKRLCKESR